MSRHSTRRTIAIACLLLPAAAAVAREAMYDARPYDTVVLKSGDGETELEVAPLDLPDRREPRPRPSGRLTFQLLDQPGEDVEAPWSVIDRIEFFEQRLLIEANRLSRAGDFDAAFDYYARLDRDYPDLPGLEPALEAYLKKDALARFRDGRRDQALMLLQTLHERVPTAEGVAAAVDAVANKALTEQWQADDFDGIRATLSALRTQFRDLSLGVEDRWRGRLAEGAQKLRDEARRLSSEGDFREALRVVGNAEALEPDSIRNERLRAEIRQANPILGIGVFQQADPEVAIGLDTPAARRVGWLFDRELIRLEGYGPTGGEFGSPLGELVTDDARRSIRLSVSDEAASAGATAHRVARALLSQASGPSPPLLVEATESLAVAARETLVFSLRRQHPQPTALLKGPMPPGLAGQTPLRWEIVESTADRVRYTRAGSAPAGGGFTVVDEILYRDDDAAVSALINGEIDVLASVPPWQLDRLRAAGRIAIGKRRFPTLHCLLFGPESPLRANRDLRRALSYALARETTLRDLLLAGESLPGFEPLTAPLPQGLSLGDPLRYAYNDSVTMRPYEPRLAALLLRAANRATATAAGEEAPTQLPELVLAHPPTPLARLACDAIKTQLAKIGLTVSLREANEEQLATGGVPHDLRYAEIVVGEPMVDVWRLFGPGGLTGDVSTAMLLALDRVQMATTGQAVAAALREVHEVSHNEAPLVPLWQTVDYFAYRSDLAGPPETTAGLYQTIDRWRMKSDGGGR